MFKVCWHLDVLNCKVHRFITVYDTTSWQWVIYCSKVEGPVAPPRSLWVEVATVNQKQKSFCHRDKLSTLVIQKSLVQVCVEKNCNCLPAGTARAYQLITRVTNNDIRLHFAVMCHVTVRKFEDQWLMLYRGLLRVSRNTFYLFLRILSMNSVR